MVAYYGGRGWVILLWWGVGSKEAERYSLVLGV